MQNELKPCPNCGGGNLHHYGRSAEVECNDCGELRNEEEWQADTAREALLRAQLAALESVTTPTQQGETRPKLIPMEDALIAELGGLLIPIKGNAWDWAEQDRKKLEAFPDLMSEVLRLRGLAGRPE